MEIIREQIYRNGISAVLEILEDKILDHNLLLNEISCLPEFLINYKYKSFIGSLDQALEKNLPPIDQIKIATIGNEINLISLLGERGVKNVLVLCPDSNVDCNLEQIKKNIPPNISVSYSSLANPDIVLNDITYLLIGFCRSENYSLLTAPQAKIIKILHALNATAEIVMIDPLTDQTGYVQDSPNGWEPICNERFDRILTPAGVKHTNINFSQGNSRWQY
ncbi:MAG: hypothetical protein V3V14_04395 [Saprospiraceae bacterium]